MITEHDLDAAITECLGQRNPNAQTCIKLAAFYTIKDHLFGKIDAPEGERYSFAASPTQRDVVEYESDTEFAEAINGKNNEDMWSVMDELMSTLSVLHPSLYAGVLRKIAE